MTVNTKPIGVAYEDQNIVGSNLILADEQLGYTAAAQGLVTPVSYTHLRAHETLS
jgi:hypothetical protein